MSIGANIKKYRLEHGWTQTELGKKLGISCKTVSAYESDTQNPKPQTIRKFADALGIRVETLLDDNSNTDDSPQSIGEFIKLKRKQLNLTQKDLAARLGVSDAMVSAYETGKRNPKPTTIRKIAEAFSMSPEEIAINYQNELQATFVKTLRKNPILFQMYERTDADAVTMPDTSVIDEEKMKELENVGVALPNYNPNLRPRMIAAQIRKLNMAGQQKLIDYMEDLLKIPSYQKEASSCQEQQKMQAPSESEQTEPGKQE